MVACYHHFLFMYVGLIKKYGYCTMRSVIFSKPYKVFTVVDRGWKRARMGKDGVM